MIVYKHSVLLDREKCKGCTNCLKRCPTEAIRIREGHAVINSELCIDCGECIRQCPYKAKHALYDKLDELDFSKYLIALPAPSLFGQFNNLTDADYLLQGLRDMGFSDVYEVGKAAEMITEYTRRYMRRQGVERPVISTACPVVVRLISLRFPSLRPHTLPIMPPIELAGKEAKKRAMDIHPELKEEDIQTVFISPCPAKVSWVKNTPEDKEMSVDKVVSMSEVYFRLLQVMDRKKTPELSTEMGMIGMGWASSGGESAPLMNDKYLAADGIENVIRVLDNVETGSFPDLEFIELNACNGGCVGGVLAVENPYIARVRLQTLRRYMPVSMNHVPIGDNVPKELETLAPREYSTAETISDDFKSALRKMSMIEAIYEKLPALDCGSCGAPTCRAFAEDIVKGEATEDDCIVRMREHLKSLLNKKGESHNDGK